MDAKKAQRHESVGTVERGRRKQPTLPTPTPVTAKDPKKSREGERDLQAVQVSGDALDLLTSGDRRHLVANQQMRALSRAVDRRRHTILVALVFILIFSFIWGWRASFPGATTLFAAVLIGMLLFGHDKLRGSVRDAGFRLDTAVHAAALLAPATGLIIALAILSGHLLQSVHFPRSNDAWASLLAVFTWGLAQQYVLLAFFYRQFERLLGRNALALVSTALVFAILHLPNPFLTIVTLVGGLLSAAVYQRAPNLWINGLAHGLISYHLYHALPVAITGAFRIGPGYQG